MITTTLSANCFIEFSCPCRGLLPAADPILCSHDNTLLPGYTPFCALCLWTGSPVCLDLLRCRIVPYRCPWWTKHAQRCWQPLVLQKTRLVQTLRLPAVWGELCCAVVLDFSNVFSFVVISFSVLHDPLSTTTVCEGIFLPSLLGGDVFFSVETSCWPL